MGLGSCRRAAPLQIYRYREAQGTRHASDDHPAANDYRKHKLRIITKTPYEYYAGIPAQVFIGNSTEVSRFFLLRSLPQFLLLSICSALIVLMLGLLF